MFVWERLAVDSFVFISHCGSLPSSLDGKIISTFKQTNKQTIQWLDHYNFESNELHHSLQ